MMPESQSTPRFYLLVAILFGIFLQLARACEENIYADNATGSAVVEEVIKEIKSVFPEDDHCLLRRIAFVETCDGNDHIPPGGIWALEESKFNITLHDVKLERYRAIIEHKFSCIDFDADGIRYADLNKPLLSCLAASLFLKYLVLNFQSIPETIEEQAEFWFQQYHNHRGYLRKEDFITLVNGTEDSDSMGYLDKRYESDPGPEKVDRTLDTNAIGSDVVNAVIAKLDASNIFGPDHHFLRRLAYVETSDGTDISTFTKSDSSGIWALEYCKFHLIQRVLLNQTNQEVTVDEKMANISSHIRLHFTFNVSELHIGFLNKPMLSGLIARLYLYYLTVAENVEIPLAGDIEEQAQFWLRSYHPDTRGITVEDFRVKVLKLEKERCLVNADIFFVLDVSGSVRGHLSEATEFVYDFVERLTIGPEHNQVGTIIFNTTAKTIFNLSTHENKDDLLTAINGIQSLTARGNTNIIDGLCKLIDGFKEENGARPTSSAIYRFVIMLSDGQSNERETACNLSRNTGDAARQVREFISPVLVYVIGVTNEVNEAELKSIATPDFYTHLASFNRSILKDAQEEHTESVCRRASLNLDIMEERNGTLGENEVFRYNLQIPYVGITVKVCVFEGHIQVYGSLSIANPNSALHDFYMDIELEGNDTDGEVCGNRFITGCSIPSSQCFQSHATRAKRQLQQTDEPHQPKNVYLSIVGRAAVSSFALNNSVGDSKVHINKSAPTGTTTPKPNCNNCNGPVGGDDAVTIAVVSTSCGFLLLIISCIIIGCAHHGWVVRRRKKKREKQDEYHNKLLDMKQNAEYNEYDNVLY